jgi:hypothetical protein
MMLVLFYQIYTGEIEEYALELAEQHSKIAEKH